MSGLSTLREKYPQYNDMTDQELADRFYNKHYSDMPKDEYYSKMGLSQQQNPQGKNPQEQSSILQKILQPMRLALFQSSHKEQCSYQGNYGVRLHIQRER